MTAWFKKISLRLRSLFQSSQTRSELDSEIDYHLEMLTQQHIEAGMSPDEARSAALREFGHVDGVREACKEAWGIRIIEEFIMDLRDAARQALKHPGNTLAIILTLGICLGSNTTALSFVDKLVSQPYDYQDAEKVVKVGKRLTKTGDNQVNVISLPQYAFLKEHTASFLELGLIDDQREIDLERDGDTQRINIDLITPEVWDITGVTTVSGHLFTPEEIKQNNGRVVVINEKLANQLSATRSAVVGSSLQLDGEPYKVIGIVPTSFYLAYTKSSAWLPRIIEPQELESRERHNHSWTGIAKLAPGVSVAQAEQRLNTLYQSYLDKYPQDRDEQERNGTTFACVKINDSINETVPEIGIAFRSIQAATLIILLIGCLNVSGMFLVKAYSKVQELAIRKSVGATTFRLIRQLTTEVCLYFFLGSILSLVFFRIGLWTAELLYITEIPWAGEMRMDFSSLASTAALALGAALLTSILPILSILRRDLTKQTRSGGRTATGSVSKHRLHSFFVISQVALSFVMLVLSGILAHNLYQTLQKDIGFIKEQRVAFEVPQPNYRFGNDLEDYQKNVLPYQQRVLEAIRSQPGVVTASACNRVPTSPFHNSHNEISMSHYEYQPGEKRANCLRVAILPGYFDTVGTRLRSGRDFADIDTFDTDKVVIVSQNLIDRYYQNKEPLGSTIAFWGQTLRIVGVAENVQDKPHFITWDGYTIYLPYTQWDSLNRTYTTYVAHLRGDTQEQVAHIEQTLKSLDPNITIKTETFQEAFEVATFAQRLPMLISIFFGLLALLLSGLGLYGLISYIVAERTKELGIRMAFGATPRQILGKILSNSGKLLTWGLLSGLGLAIPITIAINPVLDEINTTNPITFIVVVLFVLPIGIAASLMPASRATRIDIAQNLRL
ncbi:ABC transporter permease [Pelagicoccus sp. SDUM812002]|uniref:ABC transporter permease n=1 Tax=Pelagicoccus sp. SDUM812002 TaxID=3041266 RepID=UPI00280E1536|nr:ABC transporter permease [Pelagicoccus sp. SDUM812002]MDQ8186348.1 ABC transporter permease [Pelagicoccus sp. SDUM812002]